MLAGVSTGGSRAPEATPPRLASWVEPGSQIGGCRIERQIGRGGMGVVYLAQQLGTGRSVAVKVIAPKYAEDIVFRERFQREAQLAASIEHQNVITVHDAGEEDGLLYLIMAYVRGSDLRAIIAQENQLDPRRAAAIVAQVGAALDAAHARGLVHRDVKPANVLVASRDAREHVYLTDFGLTKRFGVEVGFTNPGEWVGTVDYMAPEQLKGLRVDASADIYALGCVLYQSLTGRVPYPRETDTQKVLAHVHDPVPAASALRRGLSPAFDEVIRHAMAKDPAHRFRSAGDLGRAAIAAAAGSPISHSATRSVATGAAAARPPTTHSPSSAGPVASVPTRTAPVVAQIPPSEPAPSQGRLHWSLWALVALALFAGTFGVVLLVTLLTNKSSQTDANRQAANHTLVLASSAAGLTDQLTRLAAELGRPTTAAQRSQIQAQLAANGRQLASLRSQTSGQLTSSSPQVRRSAQELNAALGNIDRARSDLSSVAQNPSSPQAASKVKDAQSAAQKAKSQAQQSKANACQVTACNANNLPSKPRVTSGPGHLAAASTQLQWLSRECGPSCPPRPMGLTYDGASGQVLLVGLGPGGSNPQLQTWTWDGSNWQRLSTSNSPTLDGVTAMAYDPADGSVVLVGYTGNGSQTWTWNGTTWAQQQPTASPPPIFSSSIAYDPSQQDLVLFGGSPGDAPSLGDTWLWDGSNWTKAKPQGGSPGPRQLAAMAYDPSLNGVLLFGGVGRHLGAGNQVVAYHDTWLWNGARWQLEDRGGSGGPPSTTASAGYSMIINPLTQGISVLGDDANGHWQQWQWNGSGWASLASAAAPSTTAPTNSTLSEAVAEFDTDRRQIVELNSGTHEQTWLGTGPSRNAGGHADLHMVSASGSVGSLVLGTATEADVINAVGLPDAEADASPVAPGFPPSHAIGYNCTPSGQAPSGYIAAGNPSAALKCMTVYWVNSTTAKVTSFQTVDPTYRTAKGTRVGMAQAQASQLEGQPAITGCGSGISETGSAATLRLLIQGGTNSGSAPSNVLTGGAVSEMDVELKQGGVGIQFC